jgi:hypothetical protein
MFNNYQVTKLTNIAAFGATTALIYELSIPNDYLYGKLIGRTNLAMGMDFLVLR